MNAVASEINAKGYAVLKNALPIEAVEQLLGSCIAAFETDSASISARSGGGHAVAARNVMECVPEVLEVWRRGLLSEVLTLVLGQSMDWCAYYFSTNLPIELGRCLGTRICRLQSLITQCFNTLFAPYVEGRSTACDRQRCGAPQNVNFAVASG